MNIAVQVIRVERFSEDGTPPAADVLQPPTNIAAPSPAITAIQVTWTASLSPDVSGYRLRKRVAGVETVVGDVAGDTSSYTFQSLTPETVHHLSVSSLRGSEESEERAQITVSTLPAAVAQSTISFRTLEFNAVEDSTVEVVLDRVGGNNALQETVYITETPGASGTGTITPVPPVGGVDYTITWPGPSSIAGEATFLANETEAAISFFVEPDVLPDVGEHVSFGITPSATEAYLVDESASTSVVNLIDATVDTYADSTLTFTALEGATSTYIRAIVDIDPTHPTGLPVFELVGDLGTTTADVTENTRLHNELVDTVVVVGKVEHAALTGDAIYGQTVILRETPTATAPVSDQYENVDLSALRFEVRDIPTHGTIEVDPYTSTLAQRTSGKYGKEILYWGYAEAPASTERFGFKTAMRWVGDVDMVMVEVMAENNLFDPTDAAGMYAAHPEVAGDVYFEAMGVKTSTIPAGWEIGHYHHNETSMVGDDFIVDEGGLQVIPAKCRTNIKRFYLRKTATSTQAMAEAKFSGAGLGMVTAGPLMPSKHFGALSSGVPAGIWPNTSELRAELESEWGEMLARIKSGDNAPGFPLLWGSQRWGHYHASGTRQYVEGGGHYLFGAVGFSNEIAELNLVRHYCYMSQGRACTGLNDSTDGSVVTPKALADNNGGAYPGPIALDGSDYETWFRHMRPDAGTTHGTGSINPNITPHNSGDHSLSLMPLTNPWSIPGATAVISNADMFPMQYNSGSYGSVRCDPPQGTHHKRHMIMLQGLIRMEGSLLARWLAGEEASHVMHSHTQYPQDASGTTADWNYHDLEWPMVEGIKDITVHKDGRPFHCQNGGGGGTNPARIHRLSGEVQDAVALGMACSQDRDFRAEIRSWGGMYITLADLRCSPVGWGARAYSLTDPQTSPHAPGQWSAPDTVNQRGGWPSWMIGVQSFWQMLASEGFTAIERRIRPRTGFNSGQIIPHKRMVIDTFMEQVNRGVARGRKVPSAYGIVAGSASQAVDDPFDAIPDGLLNGVGTGLRVPDWLEELNRPSDGGHTTYAKATLREEAVQWAVYVASFLEQNPSITDVPIIDILRNILEGLSEEDDGAYKSLTYAEAANVCVEGYSYVGGRTDLDDYYPENFYRQRRWLGLGLMQQADYWLGKFPHWGAGDKTDLLDAPTGFSATDTATGVTMSWDPVDGAVAYRVEWGELRPHQGGFDGGFQTSATTGSTSANLPPDTYNCFFRVQAINAAGERCTSTRLAPLTIGSRATAIPELDDVGGGGNAPNAPTIVSATGQGGSIEVEFTLASTGAEAVVIHGDYDTDIDFPDGTSAYIQISSLDAPIAGVYKASITGLTNGTYYVGLRARSAFDEASIRSNVVTATVTTAGSGSTSGDAPVDVALDVFNDGVTLSWSADGNVTGSYYAGYGDDAANITELSWTNSTLLDINDVPTGVRFYSVQHTHSDGTRSPFAEPAWSYPSITGQHIGGINDYVRPIERPQGTPTDTSLGHVGCGVDTVNLQAPPSYWVSSGEYVLPYTDPTGVNPDSPSTIVGYAFDRPVRVAGSALAVQSFYDCEFNAYGPLPENAVNYTLYVKAGDSARINVERCTIKYGGKGLYFRGGTVRDCCFKDVGEDGIHIDWLVHHFGLIHCAFPGIGNVAAQGLEWDGAQYVEYGTVTPASPHGDGLQIRTGNNGGSSPSKGILIEGNDIPVLWWDDPEMPGDHTIISMSSGIFLETANGPITQFTIQNNWVGSAANSIQIVDDGAGHGAPQGDLLNNVIVVAGGTPSNPIDSDVTIGTTAANRDTDGNNL